MSTGLKIVIIVIVLVLLYLAYRYFFITNANKNTTNIPIVHSANATGINVVLPTINNKCLELSKLKSDIADLLGIYQESAQSVVNGIMPNRGGPITDPVTLMNLFKEAEYNYNNNIIQYNSIITADKCPGETAITPIVIPVPVPNTARKIDSNIDCNSLAYRQKLSLLQITYEQAKVQYQLALINKSNYDVAETRQKFTQSEVKLEKSRIEFEEYYKLCNKK